MQKLSGPVPTTMYLNATPGGSFANPNSFRAGSPIQTSTLRQQVIVNTATQTFTVGNEDTITSTRSFLLNGQTYELGKVGDSFVTTKTGVLNTPGSLPTCWFAGYSVGTQK